MLARDHIKETQRGSVPEDGERFTSLRQVGVEENRGGHLLGFSPSCENQGVCSSPLECVLLFRDPGGTSGV